jgi:hypothetical protein
MFRQILTFFISMVLISCGQNHNKANFDKIVFHTSMCFGFCPVYHLEIDKDKKILLYSERVYKDNNSFDLDSNKVGYFKGLVNDTTFEKLTNEIKAIGIDTIQFNGITCCDGSVKTIIFYNNGKRTFLQSMVPPKKVQKLISILYNICETSNVKQTDAKFVIESPKPAGNTH